MRRGFTLIELLIVIAVIAILIGIALPRFRSMQEEGMIAQAKGELRTLQTAIESYYIHNSNTYPVTISAVTGGTPMIVSSVPIDPFGTGSYAYVRGGSNNHYYVTYSVGPGGNGSASIAAGNTVSENNGESCIYVSNIGQDSQP